MDSRWPPGPSGNAHNTPQHHNNAQSPPSNPSNLPPPPPGAQFPPFHQASHSLASLAGISQSSPRQPQPPAHTSERPLQPPGFPLPGLTQATGQPAAPDRERAREEIHIKEEEDRRHRELERQRLEQAPPHQAQQGPPMLHQPVAVGPGRVHGPNGILGNPAIAGPHLPLGAPTGPGNIFAGGPVQPAQGPLPQQMQPGLLMPFAPTQQQTAQQQQMGQAQAQGQGQQPILNDALSYLDQVKVQFADHPDVYNRFLDIMKDFKSGAIDTPGVIGRVSTLFAGNPELIQGFNTFLPPGYRIECGTGDDPNSIRVTTPMGTTVQSMPQPRPLSRQDGPDGLRPANGTYTPQPGAQSAQMMFSPSGRPVGPSVPGQQHLSPLEAARQQEQQTMHAQDQRGVTSLQSAIAANAGVLRSGLSPRATPMPGQQDGQGDGQGGMEKRGPVEFNHAISYVNKIKNRFSAHPDIYKQFLEILQTYQRESKPIQDVYSQVTRLFNGAPDLLEDFKQFLPESAAQAKAAERARMAAEENSMMSNMRGEGGGLYGSPVMSRETHIGTPSHGRGLPPVGNFAPTPISKDNKKRKPERQGTADSMAGPSGGKAAFTGPAGKRQKQTHAAAKAPTDQPPVSPALIPALPVPIHPTTTSAATHEEMSFFDRVKKAIGNKQTFNEFLKLCNLFSQDLIDRSTLAYRGRAFIGGNAELMKWFETFLGSDEVDILVENKPRIPTGRISLSNCRGLGPSYRLLPKRERQKPCSGRDELCNSVLNDEWASHPTWASEDSGFIAHRKNLHEEGLHRIEEERHDYDYNIEACARTIQLLEPLAQQLRRMSDAEQKAFQLPNGLGGQSETIYKRIIMKIYGRDKGHEVIDQLHNSPFQVIPVLLNRLKERCETWKMAQREWEKVWREQTQKMFWRSLDHQAVNNAKGDKRQFQTKSLQSEIAVKHEEMKRQETMSPGKMKEPQMEFLIEDLDVVVDATFLLLQSVHFNFDTEHPKLAGFVREFVPLFFGLDPEVFNAKVRERFGSTPPNEAADEPFSSGEEASTARGRKPARNGNLLRTTLNRNKPGNFGRKERDDSAASASRATTPDVTSNAGDPEEMALDPTEVTAERIDKPTPRWYEHPSTGNSSGRTDVDPNEPQHRDVYKFWSNTSVYCFMRMFVNLYERLLKLKLSEPAVMDAVRHAEMPKPALVLGIVDKMPHDYFPDSDNGTSYYKQMLVKLQDVIKTDLDFGEVEEALRRFYLQSGYPMYAFEKMIVATSRFALQAMNGEGKEKSWEIFQLFRKDRVKDATTAMQQAEYRKAVERMVKDGDLYRIDYDQAKQKIAIYLARKGDPSYFDNGLSPLDIENRWRAYIASYQTVDDTDGVDREKLNMPLLLRNARAMGTDPKSVSYPPSPPLMPMDRESDVTGGGRSAATERIMNRVLGAKNEENLVLRIEVNSYISKFDISTQETWVQPWTEREAGQEGVRDAGETKVVRGEEMQERFLMNHAGMRDVAKEDVERRNERFSKLINDGTTEEEQSGEAMDVDGE
ncbi:Transcriptional regulatory protein sin3 [Elasticomyces elasticus]|nr:Transcriptional regulatory protein sin3 [Elasticomyces elasticus]KAK3662980.1 Transcriptional regulatory protein sin3 [Elasticomyces elasticus]KAK4918902.1 Transcriptional regulatory protein sin3 [Elasticomyces elasticus]KAK5753786.1 Transcriptional regulatory protein sin3 [Elasticomyces elasticus]